jgi:D-serine deaminase-like pyridoxal phosphate-dependent protein
MELAEMQVGQNSPETRFVVSTVAEMEFMLPMFQRLQSQGRSVSVLYGMPLPLSQVNRLASAGRYLGGGSIVLMIDHASQLSALSSFYAQAGFPASVFLKVDTGYHRAGLPPHALNKGQLLQKLVSWQAEGIISFKGLYSHSSLSYKDSTSTEAIESLLGEINGCLDAVRQHGADLFGSGPLVLSVGASPQVSVIQTLAKEETPAGAKLIETIKKIQTEKYNGISVSLELHAGVYSVLDMQQLSTRSSDIRGNHHDQCALSVLAEVISVYNDGERPKPEVLVAAGTLALGREPCQSYAGWGVMAFDRNNGAPDQHHRLIVERISQEHSILSWEDSTLPSPETAPRIPLSVGDAVRIVPNHACVAGAMHEKYFVVDSSIASDSSRIVGVWERARGW